jgi:hypothetical protein
LSVSIVNGYLCYSACDAAKARAGKDPHPKSGDAQQTAGKSAGDSPAVVFGGALAGSDAVSPAAAASAAEAASVKTPGSALDVLA